MLTISFENLQQPTEKDVIKMSSQTTDDGSDPVVSHILYQQLFTFLSDWHSLCRKLGSALF
jgi:hypothetical protein